MTKSGDRIEIDAALAANARFVCVVVFDDGEQLVTAATTLKGADALAESWSKDADVKEAFSATRC